jgi:fermentation-respiration switch protein FrsA (DUF1100 family)
VWRRAAYWLAGLAAAGTLFIAGGRLMLEAIERHFIYFPTRVGLDAPVPPVAGASAVEEVWLEAADGVRLHGLYARADDAFAELLFFHGNAGSLYDRLDNVALLVESGINVLIIDYRGYGKSGGEPSERALYEDALLAYRHLREERGVDPARLVVFGRSLGSAVAIDLASREPVAALIAESAFTSARELGRLHYGWVPQVVLRAMSHEFDSLSKVRRLRVPALFVHGDLDTIVPIEMGRRLYEAAPEPKEWYEIRGAGHNDTVLVGGGEYVRRLVDFAQRHVGSER